MPVELTGRGLRQSMAEEFQRLALLANKYRGAAGVYAHDSMHVDQPNPSTMTHRWSLPENVERRKLYGWKVVTADRGPLYNCRAEDIDKAANCCRRLGQILLEADLETAASKPAFNVLTAIQQLDGTTSELFNAMDRIGANPRDLDNDPKYAKRLENADGPTPMEHRRKLGKATDAEAKHLKEQRLFQQIRRDLMTQEKGHGLQAAVKEMMPSGPFSPEQLAAPMQSVGGVREIVLSANPDLTADFD